MAPRLGERFAPLVSTFVPPLLQICGRTNKVTLRRAERSLHLICRHCRLPQIVPYLLHAMQEKAATLRSSAASSLVILLEVCEGDDLARRVADIERAVQILATDANPQVRALGRQVYAQYAALWPARCERYVSLCSFSFRDTLSATAQRYLATVSPAKRDVAVTESSSATTTDTMGMRKRVKRIVDNGTTASNPLQERSSLVRPPSVPKGGTIREQEKENIERSSPQEAVRGPRSGIANSRTNIDPMPWADPFQETGVPPLPSRGSNPSDGVAYRLAIAREQARLRSAQRQGINTANMDMQGMRLGSRALVRSSASIGSAKRVVRPRAAAESPRYERAATSKDSSSSPWNRHNPGEFTPKRRPFSVVNADRSPQNRTTPNQTEKCTPITGSSPWARIDT